MSSSSEAFRLIQPGLMSIEELKTLLSQRGVCLKSYENKNKEELVDLYIDLLLPLSQRKFPNSHQGKIINKKIAAEDLKQSKNESNTRNNFQYGFKDKPSSSSKRSISNESSSSNSQYHLKPPIDTSSVPFKKICLSRRPSSDKELDKIVINNHSKRHSESSSDKSEKETSGNSEKQNSEKKSPVKSHQSSSKESRETDKGEPREKRRKIAWP